MDAISSDEDTVEVSDSNTDIRIKVAPRETRENGIEYRRPLSQHSYEISIAC